VRRHRSIPLAHLTTLLAALAVAGCGGSDGGGGGGSSQQQPEGAQQSRQIQPVQGAQQAGTITIGSKNFDEQFILGEIYAQALTAGGYDIETELDIGSEVEAFAALKEGEIDGYPEYTGTALTNLLDVDFKAIPRDPQGAFQLTREEYAKEGITALPPTPFENSYRIGLLNQTAQELGNPTAISQLSDKAQELSITGYPECRQRSDCRIGVEEAYGLKFGEFVTSQTPYEVLDEDQADLAFVFTTDGQLVTGQYKVLEDDKQFFPPYNVTLGTSDEAAQKLGPEGAALVQAVQEPLTNEVMQELNSRVAVDREEPEQVATDYLNSFGFVTK